MSELLDIAREFGLPIAGAAGAGAVIGLEREYRGHPAGLRTHMLVALSSAFLMLAAVHQVRWLTDTPQDVIRIDPVRMAHGVLTGIGFLCGGVIFRQGFSVHGLTTAASLWMVSALGVLYGVGFFGLALGGTVTTVLVLVGLRWIETAIPHLTTLEIKVRYRRGETSPEPALRALAADLGLACGLVSHSVTDGGQVRELSATLRGSRPGAGEALAARLAAAPDVREFEVKPRRD